MSPRRGKRGEPFWPSMVMRKWFNIKPKLSDFSEDEAEAESDDNDDEHCEEEVPPPPPPRLRWRRKSETLRLAYISNKEVRVVVGTWNVNGRSPDDDLDLSAWLCATEPADMYVLGFQEVVPLNAGNVLGAEDSRPIPKWEAVIRRTLNDSLRPKPPPPPGKCYSAPPSPPPEPPPADWPWPEQALDSAAPPAPALRRNVSSLSLSGAKKVGIKRLYSSSGNLGMLWSEQQEALDVLQSLDDMSDRTSEEEAVVAATAARKPRSAYVRIVSKQMIGIYMSVWVTRRLRLHINHLEVAPVGTGILGYIGNKGSVSVSMSLFQSRLCFVCSHLTSGHKLRCQQRRNSDVGEILQRTLFSSSPEPMMISSHDHIFWFGDLNYRINLPDDRVRELISKKRWDELLKHDELSGELIGGNTFDGWKEGPIDFAPTYKYALGSHSYAGGDCGEKRRTPAWCDRILWLGKGVRQQSYWRSETTLSDHRPVSAAFTVEAEVFDQRKLERVLKICSAGLAAAS